MDNLSQTDVILSKCCFIPHNFRRDAWWNLWSSGSYGSLDNQNKMALPSMYRWRLCRILTSIERNTIAIESQSFAAGILYCNMSRIRPRLIRCHWSFDPRWVKISGHSEQLGPCGSTSHFVNNRHSKSQNSGCVLYWRFWPNWWSEKIRAGNSPK